MIRNPITGLGELYGSDIAEKIVYLIIEVGDLDRRVEESLRDIESNSIGSLRKMRGAAKRVGSAIREHQARGGAYREQKELHLKIRQELKDTPLLARLVREGLLMTMGDVFVSEHLTHMRVHNVRLEDKLYLACIADGVVPGGGNPSGAVLPDPKKLQYEWVKKTEKRKEQIPSAPQFYAVMKALADTLPENRGPVYVRAVKMLNQSIEKGIMTCTYIGDHSQNFYRDVWHRMYYPDRKRSAYKDEQGPKEGLVDVEAEAVKGIFRAGSYKEVTDTFQEVTGSCKAINLDFGHNEKGPLVFHRRDDGYACRIVPLTEAAHAHLMHFTPMPKLKRP